jgi:hypothetical protein
MAEAKVSESDQDFLDDFNINGYIIVKNIFDKDTIKEMRNTILKNWQTDSIRNCKGLLIPRFTDNEHFENMWKLQQNKKIMKRLNLIFNNDYKYCNVSDIGIDRVIGWHKDTYIDKDIDNENYSESKCNDCDSLDSNLIVKVLIYLQDHENNNDGLKIIPGSHKTPNFDIDPQKIIQLHPNIGDIVIFDQRLLHCGQTSISHYGRILVTLAYGIDNEITDEYIRLVNERITTQKEYCGIYKRLPNNSKSESVTESLIRQFKSIKQTLSHSIYSYNTHSNDNVVESMS